MKHYVEQTNIHYENRTFSVSPLLSSFPSLVLILCSVMSGLCSLFQCFFQAICTSLFCLFCFFLFGLKENVHLHLPLSCSLAVTVQNSFCLQRCAVMTSETCAPVCAKVTDANTVRFYKEDVIFAVLTGSLLISMITSVSTSHR